jgi:uncharacterized SAM-binding protein YcdF (DUF218 family)
MGLKPLTHSRITVFFLPSLFRVSLVSLLFFVCFFLKWSVCFHLTNLTNPRHTKIIVAAVKIHYFEKEAER